MDLHQKVINMDHPQPAVFSANPITRNLPFIEGGTHTQYGAHTLSNEAMNAIMDLNSKSVTPTSQLKAETHKSLFKDKSQKIERSNKNAIMSISVKSNAHIVLQKNKSRTANKLIA